MLTWNDLYPQQKAISLAKGPYIIVTGGIGTMKTTGCVLRLYAEAEDNPLGVYMVLMQTYAQIATVFMSAWKRYIHPALYTISGLSSKGEPPHIRLKSGAKILYHYAEKPGAQEHFRGSDFSGYYVSQAELIRHDDLFRELDERTRLPGNHLKMLDANGGNPNRPAYARFINPDSEEYKPKGMKLISKDVITHYKGDNATHIHIPTLAETTIYTPEIIEDMYRTYGNVMRKHMLEGEWVADDGLVYQDFSIHTHVMEFDANPGWTYYAGVDFGYENPFAAVIVGVDHDGRLWVVDEIVRTKQGFDLLCPTLLDKCREYNVKAVFPDPSNKQLFMDFQGRMRGIPVMPGKNDVKTGIAEIRGLLTRVDGQGNPYLIVHKRCKSVILEMQTYEMLNDGSESPKKANDHTMDALKYAAMSTKHYYGRK